jgi:hypothetical protein
MNSEGRDDKLDEVGRNVENLSRNLSKVKAVIDAINAREISPNIIL